jgi:hypothetical protein
MHALLSTRAAVRSTAMIVYVCIYLNEQDPGLMDRCLLRRGMRREKRSVPANRPSRKVPKFPSGRCARGVVGRCEREGVRGGATADE